LYLHFDYFIIFRSDCRTALSVAASQGHLKVVNLLLERNSEVDHQDRDGTTPLLVAPFEGHKSVLISLFGRWLLAALLQIFSSIF
jgi:ankyrin repeat protein